MIPLHLIPKAKFHGFADVKILSIGKVLQEYIHNHEYYDEVWVDEDNEFDLYESIRQEIQDNSVVANSILAVQQEMMATAHPLLILKDLELLHPYDKIGRIEQLIYNKIDLPILILYPGSAQGTGAKESGRQVRRPRPAPCHSQSRGRPRRRAPDRRHAGIRRHPCGGCW